MYASRRADVAVWCARIGYVGVIFIPIFVFHFVAEFLKIKPPKIFQIGIYLIGIPFLFVAFTDLFISGMYLYFWGFYPTVGPAYKYFVLFFALVFLWSILVLFKRSYISTQDIVDHKKQNQTKYLFYAFLLATTSLVDYVQNYGLEIYPWGYLSALAWIVVIALAIVRHQLMDIEVILKKTLVFAGLLIASYVVLATFAYIPVVAFDTVIKNRAVTMIPSVVIIVLMLKPLESFLRTATDKFLFQKKYDYKKLLKTFTDEVLSVLELSELVNTTASKLSDIIKLENAVILLYDEDADIYRIYASTEIPETSCSISPGDKIIRYLQGSGKHLIVENPSRENKLFLSTDCLNKINPAMLLPLTTQGKLIGILSLGKKKSDEPFTQDDVDILMPLARALSIAITNAQLFVKLSESQASAAQKEKMAVIGTLSAGINHEICNPLGIARGQCEMFLLNMKDGLYKDQSPRELLDKAQEIMEKVIHETDRATLITRKLSSFAKPAKLKIDENVHLDTEINEVMSLLSHDLSLENIELLKDIEKDLPAIAADRKQIQEIFFNIIRNAAQSIKSNGQISIRAVRVNNKIYIDIKDSGCGISKKHLGQIFDPFFTTKDPGKGTGLGLFIVKQIVERNNGHIHVQSELGKGTHFRLMFNTSQASAPAPGVKNTAGEDRSGTGV